MGGCVIASSFYSLGDVNAAIVELLADLNERLVLRRVGRTRRQLFEELDYGIP